ncbi:hypothetical protein [Nocardioides gilvus]|uniref:hypothetical protein n=1 Tax=Nocardioides gilvus TaxID=1735589 RepID=UPI000D74A317|nr:hypothetical protein [Nocardioides gilvus]
MRITHRLHRRVAGVLAVSLTCAVLGACANDSEQSESSGDAATNAASGEKVPVPVGLAEAALPEDFPDWMPRPKQPHVLVELEDTVDDETVEETEGESWSLLAAYAEDSDLEAEFDHFRQSLEENGFSIEDEKTLGDVESSPGMRQGSLRARNDTEMLFLVLTDAKGDQPLVTVTAMTDPMAGLDE